MDTTRAQQALSFQHHTWPEMLAEMRAAAGWRRYPMRLVSPVARHFLKRRAAYRNAPGRYADPWGAIRTELGDPRPDIREQRDAVVRSLSRRLTPTAVRHRWLLDNRGQLAEEFDRGCDGAVDEGSEIVEGNATPDPLRAACDNTDALWIR